MLSMPSILEDLVHCLLQFRHFDACFRLGDWLRCAAAASSVLRLRELSKVVTGARDNTLSRLMVFRKLSAPLLILPASIKSLDAFVTTGMVQRPRGEVKALQIFQGDSGPMAIQGRLLSPTHRSRV